MTSGQHFTRTQRGAVNRFYEHADTRNLTQLQELVTELYLAEGAARDKLWKKADEILARLKLDPERVAKATSSLDVKKLAALILELTGRPTR
jgi:hypothetical protein